MDATTSLIVSNIASSSIGVIVDLTYLWELVAGAGITILIYSVVIKHLKIPFSGIKGR